MSKKYVIYRRVSTSKQDLGLDAQDRDIALFLDHYSDQPYEVLGTFTDKLSGKDENRPALQEAMALASKHKAELLVSKLDRLSRDVEFVARVLKNKDFTLRVASMPTADAFQLHIYAALAQQERTFISVRTKQALAAAKARGIKLGGDRGGLTERNKAAADAADVSANKVASIILPMHQSGSSLTDIAKALNTAKVMTPRGKDWAAQSVKNALKRLSLAA